MSRGLGQLQRRIPAALQEYDRRGPFDAMTIVVLAGAKIGFTDSQWGSCCRALRSLARAGLVEVAGQRHGRRVWRLRPVSGA